ncbi:MAG: LptF/LptG family permease [Chitinophagales bacterium]|nr:LptF/LptG family permease [Chitinophagales bacterium]
MFKVLDKYIIKQFLVTFFFAIFLLTLIAVVIDITEKIDNLISNQAPFKAVIFDYYFNFIPWIGLLLAPLFVFISVIYFTSRLTANTEVICILNGGISFYRLLLPYLFTACALALFFGYYNHNILPKQNAARIQFEETYSTKKDDKTYRQNYHFQLSNDTFFYAQFYTENTNNASNITLEVIDSNTVKYRLEAQNCQYDSISNKWKIKHYKIRKYDSPKDSLTTGVDTTMYLPIQAEDFILEVYDTETMTTDKLSEFIDDQVKKGAEDVSFFELEKYRRTAIPFSVIILTVIGVAMTTHKVRNGMGIYLVLGLLISGAYIIIQQFSSVFATKGNLDPLIGAWIPNIIFSIVAIILLIRAPK